MALFTQDYFDFFSDLSRNNEREWFTENKARYEASVAGPLIGLIHAMGPLLGEISPHFVADPRRNGGSMFRIYRDTRFGKDKTPYKTHGAIQFRHTMGKDVHCPGFYMHAGTTEVVAGVGIWRPDGDSLTKIRKAIDESSKAWIAARDDAAFREVFQLTGESLKRPPKGFDKEHSLLEDLKRKDHIAMFSLTPPEFMSEELPLILARRYAAATPYLRFLCKALEVPF